MTVRFAGLALLFPLLAQGQHDLFGTDQFHRAYIDERTHEITFDPFQELNWEAKARAALPWLNFDKPTMEQIERLSSLESASPLFRFAEFRAPLESQVGRSSYVLISMTGATSIQPSQLKGSVEYTFAAYLEGIERRVVTGSIVAKPAAPVSTAVFAIQGQPAELTGFRTIKFVRKKQEKSETYDFTDLSRTLTLPSSFEDEEITSAISFRLTGQQFLLVKWSPYFCNESYTLYTVGAELKPIASNDYDCDP